MRLRSKCAVPLMAFLVTGMGSSLTQAADKIVHDAEYYILESQNGERWAAENVELDKKLAALREKHGQPPQHRLHPVGRHRVRCGRFSGASEKLRLHNTQSEQNGE